MSATKTTAKDKATYFRNKPIRTRFREPTALGAPGGALSVCAIDPGCSIAVILVSRSFDQLVCSRNQVRRHLEGQRLGGFEIEDQLELHRLLHWQIGRLGVFENTIDV